MLTVSERATPPADPEIWISWRTPSALRESLDWLDKYLGPAKRLRETWPMPLCYHAA